MSLIVSTVATAAQALPSTRSNRLLILIYHRVQPFSDAMFPNAVDADRFAWHMALIRRHCHPLPLTDAVAALRDGTLPARAVAVTFDDGYSDNFTIAMPILKQYRIHATFFIATGFLDGGRMWNDTVIEALRRTSESTIELDQFGLGTASLVNPRVRGAVATRVLRAIKHLDPAVRSKAADDVARRLRVHLPDDLMMNSEHVRHISAAGMEVGAHTVHHPILRVLPDNDAAGEIVESRRTLERITGRRVRTFAYPNGQPGEDYTDRDRALVSNAGFELAVSTRAGTATAGSDPFQLPRFTPWDVRPARWLTRLFLAYRRGV